MPSCKDTTGCAWTYSTYTSTMTKNNERSRYDVNIRSIRTFGEIHVNNDEEWWTESLWCEYTFYQNVWWNTSWSNPHRNFPSYHEYVPTVLPFHIWRHNEGRITTLHNYREWGIMKVMERIGLHTGHLNVEARHFAELVRMSGLGYKATERYNTSKEPSCSKKGLW